MRRQLAVGFAAAAFLLSGCSDKKDDREAVPSVTTTPASSSTSDGHLDGGQAYVDSGNYVNGLHLAKITKLDRASRTITYDVMQFLTGDAAKKAYEQDLGEAPDTDYYIRNESTQTRTAVLADDVTFRVNNLGGYPPTEPDEGHEVDFATFAAYFDGEQAFATHFWITLEDGKAVAVEEQFVP